MSVHRFTIYPVPEPGHEDRFSELGDLLWDSGCDDASFGISNGQIHIPFDREAATFEEAVQSAVTAVRSIGLTVHRVEIDREGLALMFGESTAVAA